VFKFQIPAFLLLTIPLFAQQPNLVVIISDDAGYADWEFMDDYLQTVNAGQAPSPVPTPNLNALRRRGTLFTNAYTAAVCSPSRAAIVTGSYQQRIGYEYNINNLTGATAIDGLSPDTTTIFDRMGAEGYTTGAIGKWHIGARANDIGLGNRPENQGVDEFFGIWKGSRNYTIGSTTGSGELRETITSPFSDTVLETTAPWNTNTNYVTNAFGIGAVDFIDRHYADPAPFFLYLAFTSPHGPIGPSPDFNDPRLASLTGTRKEYASMVLTMDKEIGNILNKLNDPAGDNSVSLTDNTVVIFINDNGGARNIGTVNTPLKDFKGSVYEGGTRVPMIIAGPGLPSNATYHEPVHSIDILPTCLEATGATPPTQIDGVSLIPHLKGTATSPPHEVLTIRSESKVSVRKGNWKLTRNGASSPFSLFDLSTDIGENNDLAAANPEVVAELLRDFTAFEVGADKPRHAGLGKNANTINLNNRFVLNPQPIDVGPFTSNLSLIGGALLNGNFNTGGGSGAQTFDQTPSWQNIGSGDGALNATQTSLTANGTRNGIIAETATRVFGQDTNHTLATGEIFQATYQWRDASGWNDAGDRIHIRLFTTSDDSLTGTQTFIQSLNSELSTTDSTYQTEIALFDSIPPSTDGKRLFVSLNSAQTGSGFARLDDFTLDRGTLGGGGGATPPITLTWSTQNAWIDPDTSSADTFLNLDSFASCVLEFPTTDNFSYTASNNLTRPTGLAFMLNGLRLTGTGGNTSQTSTITGNELLFTNNLAGESPFLELAANSSNASFIIENDLTLYHDLIITGNGSANLTITGEISEYHAPISLTKSGLSKLTLTGNATLSGPTTVQAGQLTLANDAVLTSPVILGQAGTLSGSGAVSGNLTGPGQVSPGPSIATLLVTGNASPGIVTIETNGNQNDKLDVTGNLDLSESTLQLSLLNPDASPLPIASYATLTGSFQEISGLPETFVIDYQFQNNHIAIFPATSAYQIWASQTHNLSGEAALFQSDPDGDELPNGLEFLTGSDPNQATSAHPLSFTRGNDFLSIKYPISAIARKSSAKLQFSDDLISWQDFIESEGLSIVGEIKDVYGPGIDQVSITYTKPHPKKLFIRLHTTR
jgi:autotransporter-associated beta strand protein